MRAITFTICAIGATLWVYLIATGLSTASSLREAGLTDFVSIVAPVLMPVVGLSLSTVFPWRFLQRVNPALAVTVASFSLVAAILVAWVRGAASAG